MNIQSRKKTIWMIFAVMGVALAFHPNADAGVIYANGTQPIAGSGTSAVASSDGNVYDIGNWELWAGGTPWLSGSTPESSPVYAFQLPSLGAVSDPFSTATLGLTYYAKDGVPDGNVDLYGLGVRGSPTVLDSDYFSGTLDTTASVTLLEDNILTPSTPLTTADSPNNVFSTDLASYLNISYDDGANAGQFVFLRFSYDQSGITSDINYHIESNPGNGTPADLPQISYTLTPVPEPSTDALCGLASLAAITVIRRCRLIKSRFNK